MSLTAAAGYHLKPAADAESAPAADAAALRREPERYESDDEDSDGEPGFGLVSLGALIHTALTIKSALRRLLFRKAPSPAARPGGARAWLGREPDAFVADLSAYAPRGERIEPTLTRAAPRRSTPPRRASSRRPPR